MDIFFITASAAVIYGIAYLQSIKGINTAIKVVFPELSDEPFNFSMNNMASTGLQATYTTANAAEFSNYLKSNVGRTVPLLFSFYKI